MTDTTLTKPDEYDFKPLARIGDPKKVRDMLRSDRMRQALTDILPIFSDDAEPERHIARLVAQAGLAFMNNAALYNCTEVSVFEAMMHVAETGLSLSRQSGEAYLVPFRDTARELVNCTFMPGYRGLNKLAHQTGGVRSIKAVAVYTGERFEFEEREDRTHLLHVPAFDDLGDDKIEKVYCRIKITAGGTEVTVMTREQIERIRRNSKQPNGPAWRNHWGEMAKKTTIKRALKTVPQATADRAVSILERAIELDNYAGGFIEAKELEEYRKLQQQAKQLDWAQRMAEAEPGAEQQPQPQAPKAPQVQDPFGEPGAEAPVPPATPGAEDDKKHGTLL